MAFATITSAKNDRIKTAVKLRRRKHRGRHGKTLIDGARELGRALSAETPIEEIYFCPSLCKTSESRRLLERLDEMSMQIFEVTPSVFEKLAYGERAAGLVAVARPPDRELADIELPANPLVAVLEGFEKPGNLGAVVRSADAAGVDAVVVADSQTDIFNPNAIRASLGTVFTMPVCAAPTAAVFEWLRENQLMLFATRVEGEQLYSEVDFTGPAAIILGAEATGLSETWTDEHITPIKLPMCGVNDSLNVSATAAVVFYEALRQRNACVPHAKAARMRSSFLVADCVTQY